MSKKIVLLIIAFLLPGFAFAAADDVTLTKDVTQLSVDGKTIGVDTSNAVIESITVNASNFSFVLQPGSVLKASSTARYSLSSDAHPSNIVETVCTSASSSIQFRNNNSGSATITVTPGSSLCADAATVTTTTGGSVGVSYAASSGGGGAAASSATPTVTTTTVVQTPIMTTTTSPVSSSFSGVTFMKRLANGSKGTDVTNLQKYLATDLSIYPEGKVTGFFGPLTQKSVQKFQEKYGIAKKGVVGYGEVGPATRAKLNALMSTAPTAQTVPVVTTSTSSLQDQIASLLKLVAELTAQLNAKKAQ